jgi:toxin CcdB
VAGQFDVWRTGSGVLVLVIQSDLLDEMRTRVVAPLLPAGQAGRAMRWLNPEFRVGAATLVLMPQLAATLALSELGERVASLAHERDAIVRALDMLVAGI